MVHPVWDIEIDGYKSIDHAAMQFGGMNVLIGANGAGKSNVVQVFELLGRIVDQELGLFVGRGGGASTLLNTHSDDRLISVRVVAGHVRYQATLTPAANDELIFMNEWVTFGERHRSIGRGHRETRLFDELSADGGDSLVAPVVALLRGCRVYHFHDTSIDAPVKSSTPTADNLALRADAGNLAAVLLALRDGQPEEQTAYRRIANVIRMVAPCSRPGCPASWYSTSRSWVCTRLPSSSWLSCCGWPHSAVRCSSRPNRLRWSTSATPKSW